MVYTYIPATADTEVVAFGDDMDEAFVCLLFTSERQCTFGTYHAVGNDFEWVVETDEGQQIEPGYIFDGIFVTDAFGQFFVGTYFIAQRCV